MYKTEINNLGQSLLCSAMLTACRVSAMPHGLGGTGSMLRAAFAMTGLVS